MKDEQLLNIIKDYFQENFEHVEEGYEHSKPITSLTTNSQGQQGMFGKIKITPDDSNYMVHGEKSSKWFILSVGKFIFEVKRKKEIKYVIATSMIEYSKNRYTHGGYGGLNSKNTEIIKCEVNIKRNAEGTRLEYNSGSKDGIILTKTIEVDEKYFESIENSIVYDEDRMLEELTEMLGDIRNKKIGKLTKED